jgi:hypothetical protein
MQCLCVPVVCSVIRVRLFTWSSLRSTINYQGAQTSSNLPHTALSILHCIPSLSFLLQLPSSVLSLPLPLHLTPSSLSCAYPHPYIFPWDGETFLLFLMWYLCHNGGCSWCMQSGAGEQRIGSNVTVLRIMNGARYNTTLAQTQTHKHELLRTGKKQHPSK